MARRPHPRCAPPPTHAAGLSNLTGQSRSKAQIKGVRHRQQLLLEFGPAPQPGLRLRAQRGCSADLCQYSGSPILWRCQRRKIGS